MFSLAAVKAEATRYMHSTIHQHRTFGGGGREGIGGLLIQ